MAFSVRIEVLKFPNDKPMLILEAYGWNPQDLIEDARFEYSNETGSYADYTASLSSEEFRNLNDKYRPSENESASWSKNKLATKAILDAVADLVDDEHDTIRVIAFEWESGY